MSENKSSQENNLKQNEKIENHINNHEIPKNEAENQKCSHEESLEENEEIQQINNLQEQFENEVVESEQMHTSNIEEDYDGKEEEEEEEEEEEYVEIDLSKLKDLNCPICNGIIRKTKTIKECLHRFCRDCVDVYISKGNKKCPLCFTHFVDQSSIIYDKEYDVLIAALYPDIEKVKKESPIVEESNKGPRIVVDETDPGEEPIAMEKPIVEESDDDTASTLQSNKDRPTKK
ncbi:RING-type E3 ubiquitin transferase [Trifolium repens]|nr:RING-type E3 ubiquitin transferase [Trifolium repens]